MKKKSVIILVSIVIVVILSGYLVYNKMFPVAKPIQYPSLENIASVKISSDDNKENEISGVDFSKIITYISNSKPTRIMSVNDSPTVSPYYKLEVLTDERMYNYYIYKENSSVYVELPYEGIYIIDRQIIYMISDWI